MTKEMKIKEILIRELEIVKPSNEELNKISSLLNNFLSLLKPELKKINANVFVGGSFSKDTMIKKGKYDLDIFVRFPKTKKEQNLSNILEKILQKTIKRIKSKPPLKLRRIHGSRDYFDINIIQPSWAMAFEIIPVLNIKKPEEAENVTDLSPSHVDYIIKQIKKKSSLADSIKLIKAFSYAQNCYGAESYIRGFSGYALEILTCYYGSFYSFIKNASKWNLKKKILIDPAKYYKKNNALRTLNKAKLESPIILIDPTQKDRNAAASLSEECFKKFVDVCGKFLKNPSSKFFVLQEIDEKKFLSLKKSKDSKTLILEVKSNKEKEDVAGAKLLRFFNSLLNCIKKEATIIKAEWNFNASERKASFFFIITPRKKVEVRGPPLIMKKHALKFKKQWKNHSVKNKELYALRKPKTIKDILKAEKDLKTRGIKSIKIVLEK